MFSRCDIHVHSKHSDRPSEWYLDRIGAPESFTEPLEVYRLAKARGMDFVTISDHDSIAGALDIAHLPGTFLSSEETVTFPEDGCDLHILVLGVTEAQHRELQRLKRNLYDFRAYARSEGIVHVVAHPLFRVNDRLTLDHLEKVLVLFRLFEGVNGTRDPRATALFDAVLASTSSGLLAELAERHRLPARFRLRRATALRHDRRERRSRRNLRRDDLDRGRARGLPAGVPRPGRLRPLQARGRGRIVAQAGAQLSDPRPRLLSRQGARWFALEERPPGRSSAPHRRRRARPGESGRLVAWQDGPQISLVRTAGRTAASGALVPEPTRELGGHAAAAREAERRTFEAACRLGHCGRKTLEAVVSELERGDIMGARYRRSPTSLRWSSRCRPISRPAASSTRTSRCIAPSWRSVPRRGAPRSQELAARLAAADTLTTSTAALPPVTIAARSPGAASCRWGVRRAKSPPGARLRLRELRADLGDADPALRGAGRCASLRRWSSSSTASARATAGS